MSPSRRYRPYPKSGFARRLLRGGTRLVVPSITTVLVTSCVPVFTEVGIRELAPLPLARQAFAGPVRAYLMDGSIVVLPDGASVSADRIAGNGWRYGPMLADSLEFTQIATDSVSGVEVFNQETVSEGVTVFVLLGSVVGGIAAVWGTLEALYPANGGR